MRLCTRRELLAAAMAVPLALGIGAAPGGAAAQSVLRVIPHADLKSLDPISSTAYITRNHGYMIYDTLFAMDADLEPQPQMVESWEVSDDRLTWTFTLREGLSFHDGQPVRPADVVASLERWGERDDMGRELFAAVEGFEVVDDRTFVMTLDEPYGLVLRALGKISPNVPFIMPERVAETDPFEQVEEHIGSGPFRFEADEWVPGSKVVYTRFEDYVPRDEPPSALAGGKVARLDRVEWRHFADQTEAMNALLDGEVDFFERPPHDLVPILETDPEIVVEVNDPLGNIGFARFNHLAAPFDDAGVRRAALMAMQQEAYMRAALDDARYWRTCYSVYPCGTPYASEAGSEVMQTADPEQARAMLEDAGYDGTPVVILQPTDVPVLSAFSEVSAEALRAAGMTVELEEMDWATLTARRAERDPVDEGGWSMFHTWWIGAELLDPTAIAFSGDPEAGWFGWPEDRALEQARAAFARAGTEEERKKLARTVQERLWAIGASGHLGQFFVPVAHRDNVTGLVRSPVQVFWNISVE